MQEQHPLCSSKHVLLTHFHTCDLYTLDMNRLKHTYLSTSLSPDRQSCMLYWICWHCQSMTGTGPILQKKYYINQLSKHERYNTHPADKILHKPIRSNILSKHERYNTHPAEKYYINQYGLIYCQTMRDIIPILQKKYYINQYGLT